MDERDLVDDDVRDDTEEQRERYRELLEELRTVLPGVQVLFAFLLTAIFTSRFADLDALGKRVYAAALLGTALATITLMTPAALHRMTRPGQRVVRLMASIRLQIAGMVLVLTSMSAVLFVVVRLMFESTAIGAAFGLVALAAGLGLWYAYPLATRPPAGGGEPGLRSRDTPPGHP